MRMIFLPFLLLLTSIIAQQPQILSARPNSQNQDDEYYRQTYQNHPAFKEDIKRINDPKDLTAINAGPHSTYFSSIVSFGSPEQKILVKFDSSTTKRWVYEGKVVKKKYEYKYSYDDEEEDDYYVEKRSIKNNHYKKQLKKESSSKGLFIRENSKSFTKKYSNFQTTDNGTSITGSLGNDQIRIKKLNVKPPTHNTPYQGVLGFGINPQSKSTNPAQNSWFQEIYYNSPHCKSPVFGFYPKQIGKLKNGTEFSIDSEVTLCGFYNAGKEPEGIPISDVGNEQGVWQIPLRKLFVGGVEMLGSESKEVYHTKPPKKEKEKSEKKKEKMVVSSGKSCHQDGVMRCGHDGGFDTCDHGKWVYRECGSGTSCRPNAGSIICDYKQSIWGGDWKKRGEYHRYKKDKYYHHRQNPKKEYKEEKYQEEYSPKPKINYEAIMDVSIQSLVFPEDIFNGIAKSMNADCDGQGRCTVGCGQEKNLPDFDFVYGTEKYSIGPKDYILEKVSEGKKKESKKYGYSDYGNDKEDEDEESDYKRKRSHIEKRMNLIPHPTPSTETVMPDQAPNLPDSLDLDDNRPDPENPITTDNSTSTDRPPTPDDDEDVNEGRPNRPDPEDPTTTDNSSPTERASTPDDEDVDEGRPNRLDPDDPTTTDESTPTDRTPNPDDDDDDNDEDEPSRPNGDNGQPSRPRPDNPEDQPEDQPAEQPDDQERPPTTRPDADDDIPEQPEVQPQNDDDSEIEEPSDENPVDDDQEEENFNLREPGIGPQCRLGIVSKPSGNTFIIGNVFFKQNAALFLVPTEYRKPNVYSYKNDYSDDDDDDDDADQYSKLRKRAWLGLGQAQVSFANQNQALFDSRTANLFSDMAPGGTAPSPIGGSTGSTTSGGSTGSTVPGGTTGSTVPGETTGGTTPGGNTGTRGTTPGTTPGGNTGTTPGSTPGLPGTTPGSPGSTPRTTGSTNGSTPETVVETNGVPGTPGGPGTVVAISVDQLKEYTGSMIPPNGAGGMFGWSPQ